MGFGVWCLGLGFGVGGVLGFGDSKARMGFRVYRVYKVCEVYRVYRVARG